MTDENRKVLLIYGPTTTGKTDLAIVLAKKFNGEIISADSRQVYKDLDIGSGKVSPRARVEKHKGFWIVNGVKINGFDLVDPGARFTAADFIRFASSTISKITENGKLPIIVGGTAFYIKALTDGLDTLGIEPNIKLRLKLEQLAPKDLYLKLFEVDREKALSLNRSDKNNPRRLIRAIEVATSRPKPKVLYRVPSKNFLMVGLTAPSGFIYKKSDIWIDERCEKIESEIRILFKKSISRKWLEDLGLEYRWVLRYLKGEIPKDDAITKLKYDTHSFIRRQKTWFKKFRGVRLFDISCDNWRTKLEKTVSVWYDQHNG